MTVNAPTKWLLRQPSPDATARLFCFPFAGIGASAYRLWTLPAGSLEICAVQLPGRENRAGEPPYERMEVLASDLLAELLPYFDRPFAFFGHCMGGLLAHELAVQLQERRGPLPQHLYISASRSPHSSHRGPVHATMSDIELAHVLQSTSEALRDPELLKIVLPFAINLLRKDMEMCARYFKPPVSLPCLITTFAWRDDKGVPSEELAGWRAYGKVSRYLVDGDHFAVQTASSSLLAIIQKDFRVG